MLCRDVLKVPEYFMFDPRAEYLDPPLQGFRLNGGDYIPIEPVAGRLPSEVLGLHLERDGQHLRFFDPATGLYLVSPVEAARRGQSPRRPRNASVRESRGSRSAESHRGEWRPRREIEALRRG